MRLIKKISLLGFASLFVLSFAGLSYSAAQDSGKGSGSGLLLSPTRTEIAGQPGESKTFSISLRNITAGELNAQATLNDFKSDGVSGTPEIIIDENTERTPFSLVKMLSSLQMVNLKPGETKQVEYSITIPTDAAPGAYFGALRYSAVPVNPGSGGDRQVSLTASIAHLVFVELPGDVVQQIKLENLEAVDAKGEERSFFEKPAKASLTVKNLGNGFSRPFGKVSVNKGSKEVFSYEINNNSDSRAIVLPQSTRVFTNDLQNVSSPGKYKLIAGIAYGNGGEVVPYEVSFWYLPAWFVALLALILIALVVGGYMIYKKVARGGSKKSKKS